MTRVTGAPPLQGIFDNRRTMCREFYQDGKLVEWLSACRIRQAPAFRGLAGEPWGLFPDIEAAQEFPSWLLFDFGRTDNVVWVKHEGIRHSVPFSTNDDAHRAYELMLEYRAATQLGLKAKP